MTYVYAKHSCSVTWRGGTVRTVEGQVWRADDPFVADRADLFASVPAVVASSGPRPQPEQRPVERATRAPGEKRGGVRK